MDDRYTITVMRIDRVKAKKGLFRSEIIDNSRLIYWNLYFTYDAAIKRMQELSEEKFDGFTRTFYVGTDAKTGLPCMFTRPKHKDSTLYKIQMHKLNQ